MLVQDKGMKPFADVLCGSSLLPVEDKGDLRVVMQ